MPYAAPLDEIRFLLAKISPIADLCGLERYAHIDPALVESVLREAARLAERVIAPLNAPGDEEGARLENGVVVTPRGFPQAYDQVRAGGWMGLSVPAAHGGQGMPQLVQTSFCEMVSGANIAFGMASITGVGAAKVLAAHGTQQQIEDWLPTLADGTATATIVMTEPHAGSDIGLARTRAVPRGDGTFAVTGTKIFISYADHDLTEQIVHLVLARTPDAAPGVKGLSLFLVPKRLRAADGRLGPANALKVARLERKMGLNASPTCELVFDGAIGSLIGQQGEGIRNLFTMVNSMRLDVGAQSVGIASAALHKALAYTQERRQGGRAPDGGPVALVAHPDVRRTLMSMRVWCDGMRALLYVAAFYEDVANAAASADERSAARDLVEWLLPLIKAGGSDAGFRIANQAIQLHGGHGYLVDHEVEQLARDGRITAIYEGANGIQAIDLVTRKLAQDGGRRFHGFVARIRADIAAAAACDQARDIAAALGAALVPLERAGAHLAGRLAAAPRDALAGASPFLDLAATVAVGWMWLLMAARADAGIAAEAAKPVLARYFAEQALPACDALARQACLGAATIDRLTVEQLAAW